MMTDELNDPLKDAWYVHYPESTARNVTNGTGNGQEFTPIRDAMVGKKQADDLKPVRCGCGGKAKIGHIEKTSYLPKDRWYIGCPKCDICTGIHDTEAEAIQAWNRAMSGSDYKSKSVERTAKAVTVEKPNVYKCSECGQYFHQTAWGSPVEYCSRCGAKLDWGEDIPIEYFESGGI